MTQNYFVWFRTSYLTLYDTFTDNSGVLANLSSASLDINTSLLPDLIFQ